LEGMSTLLTKWGYQVFKATEPEQAIELIHQENIQVWLVDQHLNQGKIGLDFILEHRQPQVPVALITADSDPELPQRLKELSIVLLNNPLSPASLRSWLSGLKISDHYLTRWLSFPSQPFHRMPIFQSGRWAFFIHPLHITLLTMQKKQADVPKAPKLRKFDPIY